MSTATNVAQVQDAFQRTGCAWILEDVEDSEREELLAAVTREIEEFRDEYERRFGLRPDPFELLTENSEKATAFFQAFTGPPLSLSIRIAVWRLLFGCEIRSLDVSYRKKASFEARIVIGPRHEQADPEYMTTNPWDFVILRHLGIMTISGKLVLDGYYALTDLSS